MISRIQLATVVFVLLILLSCGPKKDNFGAIEDDCQKIDIALIGSFQTSHLEGTMTFSGGLNGSVEIAGLDYNDMTCTYIISDCSSQKMSMNCEGAPNETELEILSRDSIRVGLSIYTRVGT
ncbi:MAG: hypothetical protein AAFR14_03140 [Bacteroidota bacterium]